MIINTVRFLARIHAAYATNSADTWAAADTCLSFLVLHLREPFLAIDGPVLQAYEQLPTANPLAP